MYDNFPLFGVVGRPILHSKSPTMFNAAFKAVGIDAYYTRLVSESSEQALEFAFSIGCSGINVTSPFKDDIVRASHCANMDNQPIKSANTVSFRDGRIECFNTDVNGVKNALLKNGVSIRGQHVLVIGAGGASASAIAAITQEGGTVTVINRTFEKAERLSKIFGCNVRPFSDLNDVASKARIIISCISEAQDIVNKDSITREHVVLDALYAVHTPLVESARQKGSKIISADDWLLYQGMEAFSVFLGREAPLNVMKESLLLPKQNYPGKKVALIGLMGAGKSTVGKEIAKMTGLDFVDLDVEIEKHCECTIAELFEKQGEQAFREVERKCLTDIMRKNDIVVACGGGIISSKENISLLKENSICVWLWVSPEEAAQRTFADFSRPLLKNVANREKELRERLSSRFRAYLEACHIIVLTSGKTPEMISKNVCYEANKAWKH